MGFKDATQDDVKKRRQEEVEKKRKALESDFEQKRLRVNDGMNVYHLLPTLPPANRPFILKAMHFRPFHICGRGEPVIDDHAEYGHTKDSGFGGCFRCQTAWDVFDRNGRPGSGPRRKKFRDDMDKIRLCVQLVDFTPFFRADGELMEADLDIVERWMGPFVNAVLSEDVEAADLPEDMPDDPTSDVGDMKTAALLSPSWVNLSWKSLGKQLRKEWKIKARSVGQCPTLSPTEQLLQVERTIGTEKFETSDGRTIRGRDYDVRWTPQGVPLPEQYMDRLEQVAVPLERMDPEEDTLEARAFAFEKFGEADLRQYLEQQGHTFTVEEEPWEESGVDADDGSLDEPDPSDPDSFGDASKAIGVEGDGGDDDMRDELTKGSEGRTESYQDSDIPF